MGTWVGKGRAPIKASLNFVYKYEMGQKAAAFHKFLYPGTFTLKRSAIIDGVNNTVNSL